jgi:hypothetical protein
MFTKLSVFALAAVGVFAGWNLSHRAPQQLSQPLSGNYIEVRSCDVFTGPCFSNGEMNVCGKEAIMAWSVRDGAIDGVNLAGLNVIAVVKADNTLGDVNRFPEPAKSVVIVDEKANPAQRDALVRYVQKKAGKVLGEMVSVESSPMTVSLPDSCSSAGCANVKAGELVDIQTRCLGGNDHVCGNEELYYPPLTSVNDARPAFTLAAAFHGPGLGAQFDEANRRSAYLATFTE